jgi:hypothetical protein
MFLQIQAVFVRRKQGIEHRKLARDTYLDSLIWGCGARGWKLLGLTIGAY